MPDRKRFIRIGVIGTGLALLGLLAALLVAPSTIPRDIHSPSSLLILIAGPAAAALFLLAPKILPLLRRNIPGQVSAEEIDGLMKDAHVAVHARCLQTGRPRPDRLDIRIRPWIMARSSWRTRDLMQISAIDPIAGEDFFRDDAILDAWLSVRLAALPPVADRLVAEIDPEARGVALGKGFLCLPPPSFHSIIAMTHELAVHTPGQGDSP